jgi:hypothetical protein
VHVTTLKPTPWTQAEQESAREVLEAALRIIDHSIDWGEYKGRKRLPCPEQPLLLLGAPLGQYHCPVCGEMQLAGIPHLAPDEDYEQVIGQPWPAGYEDDESPAGTQG